MMIDRLILDGSQLVHCVSHFSIFESYPEYQPKGESYNELLQKSGPRD